ncbi:pentatricopeptide repeat-containing protein At2g15980 [Impatiens glandulifera]|uniref:pentatricopeptide repeat-containing protein At2g15980 n=1 Tax=Impatiens glandulifera TaxID=253017 RepID=UPI001FB05615|nr:pentatricopeptide repeat-containing protein At2g15980 [Impatiens glandulifera]
MAAAKFSPLCRPNLKLSLFSLPSSQISLQSFSSLPPPPSPPPQNLELDPSENTVSTVVSILKHRRSKSRWNEVFTLFPQGFTPTQFSEITLSIRNNPRLVLRFFDFTLRRSLCPHDLSSYSTIIHTLARARLKSQALDTIRSALRHFPAETPTSSSSNPPELLKYLVKSYRKCDSAPFVFDLLIEACLLSKKIDQAIDIVRLLRSRGVSPTVTTSNSLLSSISKYRGCQACYDMYNEIFCSQGSNVANVHTFNAVMLSFYQHGAVDDLKEIWVQMNRVGCEPNAYSYSILMSVYCDDGDTLEALKMWEEMSVKGLRRDVMSYNTLIGGFCRTGNMERAEEFYREMEMNGIESTCVTYELLMNGYCKNDDMDSVMMLYKDTRRKGFKPEEYVIDAVVRGFCRNLRVLEALKIATDHDELIRKRNTYEILIKGLCEEGMMKEAQNVQARMVGKGFLPNSEIYNAFISGYSKQGNEYDEVVRSLRMEMVTVMEVAKD